MCEHEWDWSSGQFADCIDPTGAIVDFWCAKCGVSASTKITADMLFVDEELDVPERL